MRRIVLAGIFLLGLSACAQLQPRQPANQNQSTSSAISRSSTSAQTESGDLLGEEEAAPTNTEPEKIEVEERLLSGGILEIGSADAPVTLTVFTEHHCTYCNDFVSEQLPMLVTDFIQDGNLKVQIVILPLQKYTRGEETMKALFCAAKQKKGLPMHELLFTDSTQIPSYVNILELDLELFTQCTGSTDAIASIAGQKTLAMKEGVTLVPTFILNGEKSVGLPYYSDLRGEIEAALD